MPHARVGRERLEPPLPTQHRTGQYRWRRDQPQRSGKIITVADPGEERSHDIEQRRLQQARVGGAQLFKYFASGRSKLPGQLPACGKGGEKALPQQRQHVLIGGMGHQLLERVPPDHQTAAQSIDIGQYRLRHHHIVEPTAHLRVHPCQPFSMGPSSLFYN